MQQANYLLALITLCSDEAFGQEAVEYAIIAGAFTPCYHDLDADLRVIMGEPGRPETGRYDEFCAAYRNICSENEAVQASVMGQCGSHLMQEAA